MADISKIKLPSGNEYNIKDAQARQDISNLTNVAVGGLQFRGITTTALTDGAATTSYVVGDDTRTAENGDLVIYQKKEFVYSTTDNKWHEFGDESPFGDLAYMDSITYTPEGTVSQPTFSGNALTSTGTFKPKGTVTVSTKTTQTQNPTVSPAASGDATYTPGGNVTLTGATATKYAVSKADSGTTTYTPEGTVGVPTITVKQNGAGSTTTFKAIDSSETATSIATAVTTAAPPASGQSAMANAITYWSYSNETLTLNQIGYSTAGISSKTVKTGDAQYEASQPSFTGTGVRLVTADISVPTGASFGGTGVRLVTGNITVPASYEATFTGTEETNNISVTGTPSGTVSQPTFTGTQATLPAT